MRSAALAAALCAAVVIVCVAPRLDAEAVKCLRNEPCQPPPCELLYELKTAKADLRGWKMGSFGNADLTNLAQLTRMLETRNRETEKATRNTPNARDRFSISRRIRRLRHGVIDAKSNTAQAKRILPNIGPRSTPASRS